jgi:Tfp pilus assembly protein PilO
MSLTDRDKKLVMVLAPVVLLLGYWFLILGPQRSEVGSLSEKQTMAESARDESVANQQRLSSSRTQYASDYATVVRLGKAIPSTLDMPSLLVQLETAAKGTGIDFDSITVGERTAAAAAPATGSSAAGAAPVESGGQKAQTNSGSATEQANEGADKSDQASQSAGATTSGTGSSSGSSASGATSGVPGLDTVGLTFKFEGSYFDLADFLHRVKRFVRLANGDIRVKGRLMTIDGLALKTSESFPKITAELTSTVYLSPKTEGAAAGGTPQGPAATPAATPAAGTDAGSSSGAAPAPTSGSGGAAQ